MGMLICGGNGANLLTTARSVTLAPVADTLFPAAGLYDDRLGDVCKAGTAGAFTVTADLGQATNGDMEGTFPGTNWSNASTGTGAVAQSNTFAAAGTFSARVTGGASGVGIYRHSRQLRTGFRYRVTVKARNTASAVAKLRIYNPETRNHLQSSGGAWSAASADVATTNTTSFVTITTNFTVESFKTCGRREFVTICFDLVCTQDEFVYFDAFDYWPEVDFVAVFGHNLDAGIAPQIRYSTDNFGASDTLAVAMTPKRPAFYEKLSSPITTQYFRFSLTTANARGLATMGELFISQYLAPRRAMSAVVGSATVTGEQAQIEAGDQVFSLSDEERRMLEVPLQGLVTADHEEIRDEVLTRAAGSVYPMVIVPDVDGEPDLIVHGRKDASSSWRRANALQLRETSLRIRESPYATVVG
jgi:hypothetical protein